VSVIQLQLKADLYSAILGTYCALATLFTVSPIMLIVALVADVTVLCGKVEKAQSIFWPVVRIHVPVSVQFVKLL